MCGIAGLYARGGPPVPAELIRAQCDAIRHRGPDESGILVDGDFGFGMRRLSIIDVAGSHQPIDSADGRLAIVFNGEIYNFETLRTELEAAGHAFATQGDTEVVLAAYERWGEAAWARLDGMFAVAIWDRQARHLTLARDSVGIKPLYYTEQAGGLAFASELKALLPLPGLTFETDPRGVLDYFRFGHVRTPRSIYARVRTLPPGHVLTIASTGETQLDCYWQPRYRHTEHRSDAEWIDRFRAEWIETVAGQMVADVDVGAFLSGGVDSSAVIAAMRQVSSRPVKTFTIGFPVAQFDESPHAEALARHLGCDHATRIIDLKQASEILPTVQRCYDEPFADPSAVPTWYVSQTAAEHVKVALSGDGGDELFFGYKRHATERRLGALPAPIRHMAHGFALLPPMLWPTANYTLQRWQKTARSVGLADGAARFFAKTQITSDAFRAAVFDPAFLQAAGGDSIAGLCAEYVPDARALSFDTLEQFGWCDLALNLPSAMLTKVDRASMANSLEVRVPMLGQGMVDLALGMPAAMKLRGGTGKYVVRKAIEAWLPDGFLDRRKQGFQMPLAMWFAGDFGAQAHDLWSSSGLPAEGILRRVAVEQVFAEHRAGRRDHSRFLYALAIYCLWWMDRARGTA